MRKKRSLKFFTFLSTLLRLACEAQTHFRSSLLSLRKIAIFRRERSDDRKCVCASQAILRSITVLVRISVIDMFVVVGSFSFPLTSLVS